MKTKKLTKAEKKFVACYDGNVRQACADAGISYDYGRKIVNKEHIKAHLAERDKEEVKRLEEKFQINRDRLVQEYLALGLSSIKDLFKPNGTLIPPHDLPDSVAAAVASVEVTTMPTMQKDEHGNTIRAVQEVYKYKMIDKKQPLQDMAKFVGMFLEDNMQKKEEQVRKVEEYQLPEHLQQGYPGRKK